MRFHQVGASGALVAVALLQATAQTRVDLRTQSKNVDFSNATSTKPLKTGTTLPPTCSVGEMFFKTDAQPGLNQYACSASNVWTVQGSAGGVNSVFGRTGAVTPASGDYTAAQVTNAADKTAANTYVAGARQTFVPGAGTPGLRVAPGTLPGSPQAGDLAVDANDSNHPKMFDGTSWVGMTAVPNYSTTFSLATTVTVPGSVHKLGTPNLLVEIYDNQSPAWRVEPDYIVIDPATNDVTVDFETPQSGRLVLNGAGGGGGGAHPTATAALDFPAIGVSGCSEMTMALPGAAPRDSVAAGWPDGLEAGLIGMMRVTVADTIAVRLCNLSGTPLNPAVATFRATLVRNY